MRQYGGNRKTNWRSNSLRRGYQTPVVAATLALAMAQMRGLMTSEAALRQMSKRWVCRSGGPLGGFVIFPSFGIKDGGSTCISEHIDHHGVDSDDILRP